MNYTVRSNRPVIASKEVKMQKKASESCKARKEFIASHNFSVCIDPSTKQPTIEVTKNER